MSGEDLVRFGSPTLAGLKTGSLMSCPYDSKSETLAQIRLLNNILVPKGLCLYPLKFGKLRVLVYLFRPKMLEKDLNNEKAMEILKKAGYTSMNYSMCMMELIKRLKNFEKTSFPHEIGLFLSYPPEDVEGFIENKAKDYKIIGTWKVYGDEVMAKKKFDSYKKCTDIYCKQWYRDTDLSRLAVKI